MKCKYCNAEVAPNARFCTSCGGDLSKFDKCVNCGEYIDKGVSICPHCGTEVNVSLSKEVTKSKKGIWIILAILLLCVIAGAGYYFFNKSSGNDSSVAVSETIETDADSDEKELDIHSVEGIKARLNDIFTEALSMSDDVAVKKYFTQEYQELFSKVEEYDKNNVPEGAIGFWDESIWGDGQGDLGKFHHETRTVNMTSEQKAFALVDYISDEFKGVKQPVKIDLCFENGNWFIDEISNNDAYGFKEGMKRYIKEFAQGNYSSYSFENKIYKGNGNGGGLYTEMTISFFDDNQCTCVSDWYQAYSSPKTLKGQYEIKNNMVVVKCKDGGTEHLFEFEISSNGRILKFDHSDPDMGGTMGNDYMSLEVQ